MDVHTPNPTPTKTLTIKVEAAVETTGKGAKKLVTARVGSHFADAPNQTAALEALRDGIAAALGSRDVGEVLAVGVADGHAWVLVCGHDGRYRQVGFDLPDDGQVGGYYFSHNCGATRDEAQALFRQRMQELASGLAQRVAEGPTLALDPAAFAAAAEGEAMQALALFLGVRPERVPALLPELRKAQIGETVADLAELLADRSVAPDRIDGVSMYTRGRPAETIRAAIEFVRENAEDHRGDHENTRDDFVEAAKLRRAALISVLDVTGIPTGQREEVYKALEVLSDEEEDDVDEGYAGVDHLKDARDKALARREVLISTLRATGIPTDQRQAITDALALTDAEEDGGPDEIEDLEEIGPDFVDLRPALADARLCAAQRRDLLDRLVAAIPGYGDVVPADLRAEIDRLRALADFELEGDDEEDEG